MELIAAVSTTFNPRPPPRCSSSAWFAFGYACLGIRRKFLFGFVEIVIVQPCVHGETRPSRLSPGQCGGDLGVYWLPGLALHTFPYLLSLKANSSRNLISLHYKEWYFQPADSRHCVRASGRFNAGKSPLFWQIVDITRVSCLDICVFCDME